jgi:hypothetical protein
MSSAMNHVFRPSILLLAAGLALAGCTSAAQLAERDNERCAARGFTPKTDLYDNCLLQLESDRSVRTEQRRREMMEKPFDPTTVTQGR